MPIISISLNETILKEIDRLQKETGFSSRSEILRTGTRLLISENKNCSNASGDINSILLVIHRQEDEDAVSTIKHRFEDVTTTQIHSHLKKNKCLELFILEGEANRIKEMTQLFQTNRKMEYVKLIIP